MERFLKDCVEFEVKMLENAKIEHVVPIKSIERDGEVSIYYSDDYKSFISETECLKLRECKRIFDSLRSLYEEIDDYLLSVDKLCLGLDDIMINKDGEIAFLYLPEKTPEKSFESSLEVLLNELILNIESEEEVLKVKQNLGINKKVENKNVDYFLGLFNNKF